MGGEENRVEIIEYEVLVRSKPIQALKAQKQLAGIWEGEYASILATWCEELTHSKDPDAGKDWRQEEKGATENEMVGWHHRLNGHEFGKFWELDG